MNLPVNWRMLDKPSRPLDAEIARAVGWLDIQLRTKLNRRANPAAGKMYGFIGIPPADTLYMPVPHYTRKPAIALTLPLEADQKMEIHVYTAAIVTCQLVNYISGDHYETSAAAPFAVAYCAAWIAYQEHRARYPR